ncbi:hypothetical protein M9H77_14315 [Catharanthus roseus]|uniref:Uncharacterized protein n=1 Tax=Catharanthus roseus TaxID=4058 RepID=A0ACC0BMP4_CATRO|nr:hypothetical protein M9H77_14315 [Catharanthus roseus]
MIPSNFLDLFVGKFLVKKVEGYLCSLIEDLIDKSIRRIIQLENPCDDHKILIGLKFLNAFLIENILGFQFYHLHFKESIFLLICENKKKNDFGVLKRNLESVRILKIKKSYTFFDEFLDFMSKSSWEKGLVNLVLDNLFIFNSIIGLYVDNILELSFDLTSPCELKSSRNFKNNFDWMRFHYIVIHEFLLKDLEDESLNSHVPFKEMKSYIMRIHGWVLGFKKDKSFQFRIPFKDCSFKAYLRTFLASVFFRGCFLNLYPQILDETLLF